MENPFLDKVEGNPGVRKWLEETQRQKGDSLLEGEKPDFNIDKDLFRALAQFWNPAYSCFTLGDVDLVPTVEEYTTLIRCPKNPS
ncbi:hypothetical protein HRI_004520300 [Hibiscus trionum]|uniref:DUF7745 domain-containing protein n=1 Tax=Hibiscus trionum TaxID=183268 RepID=A0A9W7J4N6_HIBTR|nr:hypothetical protein HRI_004520300 [Hibiscus trionum]